MSCWDNYREGLLALKETLVYLQTDKAGFRYPHHPERLNVNPAKITLLKNLVEHLARSHSQFEPFSEAVSRDYLSPETSPATFEQPFYRELSAVIQEQLENEADRA